MSKLLEGIRVLDLCTPRAEVAGRLLAEFGAEVLKIEPPEGAVARRLPPFVVGDGPAESLYWAAAGLEKRSAVVDLARESGRECLRRLAMRADIFLESFDPGTLERIGLDYPALSTLNPALVYVSVTPFGQKGPKALWPATSLTLEAAGGRLALQGDRDRPPIPVGFEQAPFHAAARAAADAIIALNERSISGLGQYLDTSMQEAIVWTLMSATGYPSNTGGEPPGAGDDRGEASAGGRRGPGLGLCACADGYVTVSNTSLAQLLRAVTDSVVPTLREHGVLADRWATLDLPAYLDAARQGVSSPDDVSLALDATRAFIGLKTKQELMEWAWSNDIHLGPLNTTRDLLQNPHLEARGFWQRVGRHVMPGPSVHPSRTPIYYQRAAPTLGEDQDLTDDWLSSPSRVADVSPEPRLGEAFKGLKVVDFSWVAVGPITGKALADHGATVVRIESATRVDFARTLLPFKDNVPGLNRSHWVNNLNTSKLGITLNLATEPGRDLARKLIDWADVVIENFTPGTMSRLGFDYETVSQDHPDLIMLSTCLMGQTGPWASFAGYGPHGAAMSGLSAITGWPDRAPCGPNGPYSDVIAPHFAVAAIAAALLERQRSGLGQHIDVSQVESAIHFLEPLILDESVNGRTARPSGLDSLYACPHGVYPTLGNERYIAIAVESVDQWRGLLSVAPLGDFAGSQFNDMQVRQAMRHRIDECLTTWTSTFERRDLEAILIAAGVPASVVQRPTELCSDPHLASRGFFVTLHQSEVGDIPYDGFITRFSAKEAMLHKAAPNIGEDTELVLHNILGISLDEIADYAAAGVLT